MIFFPLNFNPRITSQIARLALGSKLVVGSSEKSNSGELTSERARPVFCFCRLKNYRNWLWQILLAELFLESHLGRLLCWRGQSNIWWLLAELFFQRTVNSQGITPNFLWRSYPFFHGSRSKTFTSPPSLSCRPSMISIVVVLPAPFRPSRPKTSHS